MAKKQKQASPKLASGLPVAPWIFINNSLGTGNSYADALCSLIPYSRIYESLQPLSSISQDLEPHTISILANSSTAAYLTANIASSYQVQARERGCNLASVALCNDDTFNDFVDMDKKEWQSNHIIINVDGTSIEEVAKMIIRWLCKSSPLSALTWMLRRSPSHAPGAFFTLLDFSLTSAPSHRPQRP
jgi:hypothetical protein